MTHSIVKIPFVYWKSSRPSKVAWSRPFLPQLKPLDSASARQVFLAWSNVAEDDPKIDALLSAVECVPLAVILMANLAQTDTSDTLLLRWQEEQSELLHRTPDRRDSLEISIEISLNSPRIRSTSEAVELLSLLSLLPDGVENHKLDAIFPSIEKSKRALATLWQTSLAYNDANGRTRVLSPIRAYMIRHRQAQRCHLVPMMTYYMGLAGLAADLGGLHGQGIIKRLTPEINNLHSMINLALEPLQELDRDFLRGAIKAAIDLSKFNRYTSLGNADTLQYALSAAEGLDDRALQADVYYHRAWIACRSFENRILYSQSTTLCAQAQALYEEVGNVSGQAGSYAKFRYDGITDLAFKNAVGSSVQSIRILLVTKSLSPSLRKAFLYRLSRAINTAR